MSAFEEVANVVIAGAAAKAPLTALTGDQKMPDGLGLGHVPSCASNYSIATECDDRDDVAAPGTNENPARIESDAGDITLDTSDEAKGTRDPRQGCFHFFSTTGLGFRQMKNDAVSCATCTPYELVEPEVQLHPEALAEEVRLVAQEDPKKAVAAPAPKGKNVSVGDNSKTASLPISLSQSIDNNTFLEDTSTLAGTKLLPQEEPTSSPVCHFFEMFSCAPHQNEIKKVLESETMVDIISEKKERVNNIDDVDSVSEDGVSEDGDGLITPDDLNKGDGKSDGVHGKQSKETDIDQQRHNSAFDPVGHLLNQYESFESSDVQTLDKNNMPVFRSRSLDVKHLKAKSVGVKKKLAKKLLPQKPRSHRRLATAAQQKFVLDSVPAAIESAPESVQREYFDAVSKTAVIAAEAELLRAENELKKIELESRRFDDEMEGFLHGTVSGGASADESTVATTFNGDLDIMIKHVSSPFLSCA